MIFSLSAQLLPVGVQGPSKTIQTEALAAGLPVITPGRAGAADLPAPISRPAASAETTLSATEGVPDGRTTAKSTLVIRDPVRSGQQIYAQGNDLIVLAPVSAGAEVLADGHIHIYNSLRGRALAGLGGDRSARIFCQSLEAEMVSIAGLYRVSEDIDRSLSGRQVQIHLKDGFLAMDPL